MNRELFLSLGITIITSITLFIYFRHHFKTMEHKVNTIFQMVQNHAKTQQMPLPPAPSMMPQMMPQMMRHGGSMTPPSTQLPVQNPLIEVSDDELSDGGSSCGESDTGSERSESFNKASFVMIQNIKKEDELKQISVTLGSSSETSINLEEKTDLDDISSLEDNEEKEEKTHVIEETPDYAKMTVTILKKIASKRGITGYNKLRKQGLVDILSN